MGARVNAANHLGDTLSLDVPRQPTPLAAYKHAVDSITAWRSDVFRSRILMQPTEEVADPTELSDLQQQALAAKAVLRSEGLPEGQP
jgi:hypothetical protein